MMSGLGFGWAFGYRLRHLKYLLSARTDRYLAGCTIQGSQPNIQIRLHAIHHISTIEETNRKIYSLNNVLSKQIYKFVAESFIVKAAIKQICCIALRKYDISIFCEDIMRPRCQMMA